MINEFSKLTESIKELQIMIKRKQNSSELIDYLYNYHPVFISNVHYTKYAEIPSFLLIL